MGATRRTVLIGAIAAAVGTSLGCELEGSDPDLTQPPFQPPTTRPTQPSTETTTTQPATQPSNGPYGSGELAPWQTKRRVISDPRHIQRVVRTNGVVMFGDSLAIQDTPALTRQLTARTGDLLATHNWAGHPSGPATDVLETWARTYGLPNRILMAVGTNDIFNPPAVAANVERVMSIVGRRRTVVWVTVAVERRRTVEPDRANSAWVNRQLRAAERKHPNLKLARWAEFLAADPSPSKRYLRDGAHTTPVGQKIRNELIVQALAAAKND